MASTRDFLLELGVEEMPSAPLINAVKQLETLVPSRLDAAGLAHGDVRIVSSPRRLGILVQDLVESTEEIHQVLRGPSAQIAFDSEGNPTKAAQGFARKAGIEANDLVVRQDTDGTEYVFAEQQIPSKSAVPILTELCESLISSIEWPNYRSQRWGTQQSTFVRPIRWICCLFDAEVVPVTYADVTSSNMTFGHRVLAPGAHSISEPKAYEAVLEQAFVLDAPKRAQRIRQQITDIETKHNVSVDTPQKIFDEVVNLCEWPTALVGQFDEEFLSIPQEIICESMLSNQRYFPTYDKDRKLTRSFIVVSNGDPKVSDTILDGNERVVRARLYDAKFFYDEDLRVSLETFRDRLASVGFQKQLGTMLQKADRMEDLALSIAQVARIGAEAASDAQRAAHFAKADLVSSAVIEFTSQQGVMGGYYAAAAGEGKEVADAIRDHYRPRFAGDELPQGIAGCIVAVADKLDTIAGMFAIGEPPTGSKDPFALRRSAIGVIHILRDRLLCDYDKLVDDALQNYLDQGIQFDKAEVAASVCAFLKGRMEQIARDEHISADTIAAVSAGSIAEPAKYFKLAHALEGARKNNPETFDDLATAFSRAAHLADSSLGTTVNVELMGDAERSLHEAVLDATKHVQDHLSHSNFVGVISDLADLRAPIDAFFADVMVMDEDEALRTNRLRLLNELTHVFADIADIGILARS